MRFFYFTLIIAFSLPLPSISQQSDREKLLAFVQEKNYAGAMQQSKKLMAEKPHEFYDLVHLDFSPALFEVGSNISEFITFLFEEGGEKITQHLTPLAYYHSFLNASEEKQVELFKEVETFFEESADPFNKADLYYLKMAKDLHEEGLLPKNKLMEVMRTLEYETSQFPNLHLNASANTNYKIRASKRFLLAFLHEHAAALSSSDSLKDHHFNKLVQYSPDIFDLNYNEILWADASIMAGNKIENFSPYGRILDYLQNKGDKGALLDLYFQMAINEPTAENLNSFKTYYIQHFEGNLQNAFQNISLFSKSESFPDFDFQDLSGAAFSSSDFKGKWTFVDFWGTWCKPCLVELPHLEKIYKNAAEEFNGKLEIMTFSYNSHQLQEFMDKNNYSFPVTEVPSSLVSEMKINTYPSKILILPDGRFIRLPLGIDWVRLLQNILSLDT